MRNFGEVMMSHKDAWQRVDCDDPSNEHHTQEDIDQSRGCTEYLFGGDISHFAQAMAHSAEEFVRHVWLRGWQVVQHASLPMWMRDNDFLVRGHRPELNSYTACFKSIFRIHTETGNIWTHLLGSAVFMAIFIYFLFTPSSIIQWQEKVVWGAFFIGAIICMGFSCTFHTLSCHSKSVALAFNRLDYAGIAFLTIGSFVPYIYYVFYCNLYEKCFYLSLIVFLGLLAVLVSMMSKFTKPRFRPLRAAIFMILGLSGLIPCAHCIIVMGFWESVQNASLGWLALMAFLYLSGATIYAVRVPERILPGRFDLWFQSHQIFHIFVVIAAFVHYHGIVLLTDYRLTEGDCKPDVIDLILNQKNIIYSKMAFSAIP